MSDLVTDAASASVVEISTLKEKKMLNWEDKDMLCPMCGSRYTHISSVGMTAADGTGINLFAGGEDEDAQIYAGYKGPQPPDGNNGRRYLIQMSGFCEDGCAFTITLRQHKGVTETIVDGKKCH